MKVSDFEGRDNDHGSFGVNLTPQTPPIRYFISDQSMYSGTRVYLDRLLDKSFDKVTSRRGHPLSRGRPGFVSLKIYTT